MFIFHFPGLIPGTKNGVFRYLVRDNCHFSLNLRFWIRKNPDKIPRIYSKFSDNNWLQIVFGQRQCSNLDNLLNRVLGIL